MNLKVGEYVFSVELEDNETVTALKKLLPPEINMLELNGNEKYFYLPENLPSNEEKVKNINAGDVMLYGKNCLVIFYKSFETGYSYTRIGKIKDIENLESALGSREVQVSWEIK